MKEPGQMLWELQRASENMDWPWFIVSEGGKATWARIELAIRADEAAKVRAATIEECAKVADSNDFLSDVSTADCGSAYGQGRLDAAKAIRSLGSK